MIGVFYIPSCLLQLNEYFGISFILMLAMGSNFQQEVRLVFRDLGSEESALLLAAQGSPHRIICVTYQHTPLQRKFNDSRGFSVTREDAETEPLPEEKL